MARVVELRSDTFTQPTESMRKAMAIAEVGDDVWDEDPTIHRLQERAAEMVGSEASLFTPSGTMGNLCALLSHAQPGDEVIVEIDSHIFQNEVGGASVVGGLQLRPLDSQNGRLQPEQVARVIRQPDIHEPRSTLLCLENTHNRKGGTCLSPGQTEALSHPVAVRADAPVDRGTQARDLERLVDVGVLPAGARRFPPQPQVPAPGFSMPPSRRGSTSASSPVRWTPSCSASPRD